MPRIMIVDDDEDFGGLLRRRLEHAGFDVVFHNGAFGSLNAIRKAACELVVIDMMMPGLPGPQLVRLIRQTAGIERTKILLCSSMDEDQLAKAASRTTADGYISKSAGDAEITSKIKNLLGIAIAPESMRTPPRSSPASSRDPVSIHSGPATTRRRSSSPALQTGSAPEVRETWDLREATTRAPTVPPPPSSGSSSGTPSQRRSWNRMRSATSLVTPPVGSSPQAIGAAIAPLIRSLSARLVVGAARIHDAVIIRSLTLEEGSPELGLTLGALIDTSQGIEESILTSEIARWQAALGALILDDLRRELSAVNAYLLYSALLRAGVSQPITIELLEECFTKTAAGDRGALLSLDRYVRAPQGALPSTIASKIIDIMGGAKKPAAMGPAISRLLAAAEEDVSVAVTLVKQAIG